MRAGPIIVAALASLAAPVAYAHDARPVVVQIIEHEPLAFDIRLKVPATLPANALPQPVLPADCMGERPPVRRSSGGAHLASQSFRCVQGLPGRTVGIRFPSVNPSLSTLYTIRLASGEEHLRILKPGDSEWRIPDAEKPLGVAVQYTGLGIRHIWAGIDHLLFVACLVFLARTPRRLLITITGFTVAHSVTLILSTLDVVRLPTPPVEAAIALSVVFMAWELIKGREVSLAHRYPVAIASSFGLLHGFGFAAVLRDIGLPQTELPTALAFFNIGVEIGQVLFVAALLAAFVTLGRLAAWIRPTVMAVTADWRSLTLPAAYVIGSLASYWMIERVSGFWV